MAGLIGGSDSKQESDSSSAAFTDVAYGDSVGSSGILSGAGFAEEIELGQDAVMGDRIKVDDGAQFTNQETDNSQVNVNITDGGAFGSAIDFATETSLNNLDVIETSINTAYDGFAANSDTMDSLISNSSDLVDAGFESAANFGDLAADDAERNANFAAGIFDQAVSTISGATNSAMNAALNETAYAYTGAAHLASDAWQGSSDAASDAFSEATDAMAFANNSILEQNAKSLAAVERSTNEAMQRSIDAVENANDTALGAILGMFTKTSDDSKDTNDSALKYVSEAQRSESERTTETLLKWALGAAGIVGVAFAMRGFK